MKQFLRDMWPLLVVIAGVGIIILGFYGTVAYIAAHFILKFW
jgi:preprotein translocase subunit Sss1